MILLVIVLLEQEAKKKKQFLKLIIVTKSKQAKYSQCTTETDVDSVSIDNKTATEYFAFEPNHMNGRSVEFAGLFRRERSI